MLKTAQHTISINQKAGIVTKRSTSLISNHQLKIEFQLEDNLSQANIAPHVWDWGQHEFKEKFIQTVPTTSNEQHISSIAHKLKKLHTVDLSRLPAILRRNLQDKYARMNDYKFINLCQLAIQKLPDSFSQNEIDNIIQEAQHYHGVINKTNYNLSIIHGDLNPSNILINQKNEVLFTDWLDARIDLPTHDIAQYFNLNRLNERQEKLFWNAYEPADWMSSDIMQCHQFSLKLFAHAFPAVNNHDDKK